MMHYRIKHNTFTVSEAITNKTVCWYCHAKILKKDIRIKISLKYHDEHYHLLCYKPKIKEFIDPKHVNLALDKDSTKIFLSWLEDWNSQFKPNSLDIRPKPLKKLFPSLRVPNLRMWIEVLKYLPGIEVIQNISRVSHTFYELSWNKELFNHFCTTEFKFSSSFKCYRSLYIAIYTEACFICKSIDPNHKHRRYYHTNRNLCKQCSPKLICKNMIYERFAVKHENLNLKFIPAMYNRKCTEEVWVRRAIMVRKKKRKEMIFKYCKRKGGFWDDRLKGIDRCDLKNFEKDLEAAQEGGEFGVRALKFIHEVDKKVRLKDIWDSLISET